MGREESVDRETKNNSERVEPFRDPTSGTVSRRLCNAGVEPVPTCRTCGASVDLARRNAVTPVIYRNVACRGCGVICILEGPERNVSVSSNQNPPKPAAAPVH